MGLKKAGVGAKAASEKGLEKGWIWSKRFREGADLSTATIAENEMHASYCKAHPKFPSGIYVLF
jgi:hypothetical protein